MTGGSEQREVWDAVLAINRAWSVERDLKKFATLLHPDMVVIDPVHRERLAGRDAVLESYRGYLAAVPTIHGFRERDPKVRVFDNRFAIATYYWDMSYVTADGQSVQVSGRDMYALVREGDRWLAVADQFSEFPNP
jgi:uncharacterized protein (TIGR02246 family)